MVPLKNDIRRKSLKDSGNGINVALILKFSPALWLFQLINIIFVTAVSDPSAFVT